MKVLSPLTHALRRCAWLLLVVVIWYFIAMTVSHDAEVLGIDGFRLIGKPLPKIWDLISFPLGIFIASVWVINWKLRFWVPRRLSIRCRDSAAWAALVFWFSGFAFMDSGIGPHVLPNPLRCLVEAVCSGIFIIATATPTIWYWKHREELRSTTAANEQRDTDFIIPTRR